MGRSTNPLQRMDEITEKGLAAHWKYKGLKGRRNHGQMVEKHS